MSINNTPEIGPYTELKPFRFWCQKVLPITYDDSLSYYELLCKVVDYLNKTMEDVDQVVNDMGDFKTAYDELIGYVNNYFENLDVQTEINNKLDAMAESGELGRIMQPFFADAIEAIPGVVTDWLDDHVVQETGYVIDDSLTITDAAADAKAVGDRFTEDEYVFATMLAEKTDNLLFIHSIDVDHVTRQGFPVDIAAGTYTFSGAIEFVGSAPSNINILFLAMYDDDSYYEGHLRYTGNRDSVTFTLTAHVKQLYFYSAVSAANSPNYHSIWHDLKLEAAEVPTKYAPQYIANDPVARYDDTDNVWPYGDMEFDATIKLPFALKAGTYVISANVTSKDALDNEPTSTVARISAQSAGSVEKAYTIVTRNVQSSAVLIVPEDTPQLVLMAANTTSNSSGLHSVWKNVKLYKSDHLLKPLYDDPDIILKAENIEKERVKTAASKLSWIFNLVKAHEDPRNIIISVESTVTDNNDTPSNIPCSMRAYYTTGDQGTAYYIIGKDGERIKQEFRLPPWPKYSGQYVNQMYLQFQIAIGKTLTIHKIEVRYDDKIERLSASENFIDSHGSYMFYPQHTKIATEMQAKTGCSTSIQIPKISSDNVIFMYHDDIFDETTTILRNPDGTHIENSEYQGDSFDDIPFSYLYGLDWGAYKNDCFAGEKPMTLSEFLWICKTSGMKPIFSIHPTPTTALLNGLYDGLKNYGLLKDTIFKTGDLDIFALLHAKFTDEVKGYVLDIPRASHNTTTINAYIAALDALTYTGLDNGIEYFIDLVNSANISAVLTAGYRCYIAAHSHTSEEGFASVEGITEGDYKKYIALGVTKFTDGHNPSQGLNW